MWHQVSGRGTVQSSAKGIPPWQRFRATMLSSSERAHDTSGLRQGAADERLRRSLRARSYRTQDRPEPLLPGPPLQRVGLPPAEISRRHAGGQSRGWMGGCLHRGGGDPPERRHRAMHRGTDLGRPGRRRPPSDDAGRARSWRARRHRVDARGTRRRRISSPTSRRSVRAARECSAGPGSSRPRPAP